jgi:hypothetical protein
LGFLNLEKYPPSPLFLGMTLGGALLWLGAEPVRTPSWLSGALATLGRAPLFFYVTHLWLLRVLGLGAALVVWGPDALGPPPMKSTPEWPLWAVWVTALLVTVALLGPTRWWAGLKARGRGRLMKVL